MKPSASKSKKILAQLRGWQRSARQAVRTWRQRLPPPVKRALRRTTRWTLGSMSGVLLFIVAIFGVAYWWLPTLVERQSEIESYLSNTLGNPVSFAKLDTYWDGLNPGVRVLGLRVVSNKTLEQALRLKELRLSLSWSALLTGRIAINSLVLAEPNLTVERQADGQLRISGLEANPTASSGNVDISNLLLAQNELIIEDGELLWLDQRAGENPDRLMIRHVAITLHNQGARHKLDFRADFPSNLCKECRVSADIRGNPVHDSSWGGEIRVRARALSMHNLPVSLSNLLPAGLDGLFDLDLRTQWRNARPETIDGHIAVADLHLPLSSNTAPLTIQVLDSNVAWQGDSDSWSLGLSHLRVGLTRNAWPVGELQLKYKPDEMRLAVEHVELADLTNFAIALSREHPLLSWLRATRPSGRLNRLRLQLNGPLQEPTGYSVQAQLRRVQFAAQQAMPGMRGLSGDLNMSDEGGEFQLSSSDLQIAIPRVLREPVAIQRLMSRIRWRQNPDDWFVQAQNIALQSRDANAEGDMELRIPKDKTLSPVLKLGIDFSNGDGSHLARYYPLQLPEVLRAWLEKAIISGRVTDGHVLFHGALANFPFREGKGRFEARVHVEGGVLQYLPGWEPLRDIEANLYFTGTHMLITSNHARVRSLEVGRTAVAIEDFKAANGAEVTAQMRITGGLQETLGVLVDSGQPVFTERIPAGTHAEGDGTLTLDLRVPARSPKSFGLTGLYHFQNNALIPPVSALRVDNIQGGLEFNERGASGGKLRARILNGEATLEAVPATKPGLAARLDVQGTVPQAGLAQLLGPTLAPYVRGQAPWQLHLQPIATGSQLTFESDLGELEVSLPTPLAKARNESLTLQAGTTFGGADLQLVDFQLGKRAQGKLGFRREASGWQFARGRIGVGEPVLRLPSQSGLHIGVRTASVNVDAWQPLWRTLYNDNAGSNLDVVRRVTADVDALDAAGRHFGRLILDIAKNDSHNNWRGFMQGDSISGQIAISRPASSGLPLVMGNTAAPDRSTIHLTLEKLVLPAAQEVKESPPLDPRLLPPLHIQSQSFTFADINLGELDFSAVPATQGWKIASLKLIRPESNLTASGMWEIDSNARHTSRVDASLTSSDVGVLFETLGYPGEITGGKLSLQSNWSWAGPPSAFQLAKTDGDFSFTILKGRIPKVSPGAGRLLGALDLRSITRYLTLDFSNVFSKGLTFDRMRGKVAVEQGNAYTRDLSIRTPGADLELGGRIGLAARDLDLEIAATPHLMEELALTGGLIGGPVVGAAVVVLHNLIKKPFEESTRIKYMVKGGWDDPQVTRLAPPPAPASNDPQP